MLTYKGHSLIESLIFLLLFSVLIATAAPLLQDNLNNTQAQSAANLMLIRLQQARTLSAQRGHIIAVCAGFDRCNGSHYWQDNLLFFEDRNGDGQLSAGEQLLRQEPLARNHAWRWASFRRKPYLQLQPDGSTYALNGTLTLCQASKPTLQVVVSLGGRPRLREAQVSQSLCN